MPLFQAWHNTGQLKENTNNMSQRKDRKTRESRDRERRRRDRSEEDKRVERERREAQTRRKSNTKGPRGLNVTKMPQKPQIRKAKVPVSDKVKAWSDLLANPFTAPSAGVYPPISNDVVPCPSTKVRNYGTETIVVQDYTAGGTTEGFGMWFWPEGRIGGDGDNSILNGFTVAAAQIDASSATYRQFGPTLSGENPGSINGLGAAAGVWTPINASNPLLYTTPSATQAAAPTKSFIWDDLINPFAIPAAESDVKFRNTAFAVRISYSGKLMDTEGYVDFFNPYAWTGTAALSRTLASLRRDPSHRRFYFSNQRTHTFVWHPNCESSTYAGIYRTADADLSRTPARFAMQVGGVIATDVFEIEYICFQEFTGHPAVPTNTPSPIAHDITHVANAIPELRGKMNKGASNGPTSTLAQHVAVSKLHAHAPALGPVSGTVADTVAKHVKGPKSSVLGDIADIAFPILSLLS